MSLQSRLDIICDAAERESEAIGGSPEEEAISKISIEEPVPLLPLQSQMKNMKQLFSRRVFLPWLANIYVCDYIKPSEVVEDMSHIWGKNREEIQAMAKEQGELKKGYTDIGSVTIKEETPSSDRVMMQEQRTEASIGCASSCIASGLCFGWRYLLISKLKE